MKLLRACLIGFVAFASTVMAGAQLSREQIVALFPSLTLEQVRDAEFPGFYEIHAGTDIVYVSHDGRYLFYGEVIDRHTLRNLTQSRQSELRAQLLAKLDESRMIIFSPPQPRFTITVFTDIDCPYCRQMQAEIDRITALGIRVRYLFYPRSGRNTESWSKARNVWCAANRHDALSRAMRGEAIAARDCVNPIEEHFMAGQALGLRGTPWILAETGDLVESYQPAEMLRILQAMMPGR